MKQLKLTLALLAGLAFAGAATTVLADDSATTTITGNMVCGKARCTKRPVARMSSRSKKTARPSSIIW